MAGTPILTTVESNMVSLIEAMDTANAYNYDWGTADQHDAAHMRFPAAYIELEPEEENLDGPNGAHAGAYMNRTTYKITVHGEIDGETTLNSIEH